jgi:hypothetical protein
MAQVAVVQQPEYGKARRTAQMIGADGASLNSNGNGQLVGCPFLLRVPVIRKESSRVNVLFTRLLVKRLSDFSERNQLASTGAGKTPSQYPQLLYQFVVCETKVH